MPPRRTSQSTLRPSSTRSECAEPLARDSSAFSDRAPPLVPAALFPHPRAAGTFPRGTASWARTTAPPCHTRRSTLSTSTLARWRCFCTRPDKEPACPDGANRACCVNVSCSSALNAMGWWVGGGGGVKSMRWWLGHAWDSRRGHNRSQRGFHQCAFSLSKRTLFFFQRRWVGWRGPRKAAERAGG